MERLAEIIAGFALSLDLSTLAALASGQFATAHEKLGRNRPTHGLKPEHLNDDFFKKVLGGRGEFIGVESSSVSSLNVAVLIMNIFMPFSVHFFTTKFNNHLYARSLAEQFANDIIVGVHGAMLYTFLKASIEGGS